MSPHSQTIPTDSMVGSEVDADGGSQRTHYAILVDASGLPDDAQHLILNTIRQTRLSPSEQACVAEELIAHFADGLEADESLNDLIEAFGDTKTTAALIRRAKDRCRPKPRFTSWAVQAGVASIGVTCVGFAHLILLTMTPKLDYISRYTGVELPGFLRVTIDAAISLDRYYLWAVLLLGVLVLFEWRCKSVNKGLLRTGMFAGLSLLSVAAVLWLCFAHIVGLFLIVPPR